MFYFHGYSEKPVGWEPPKIWILLQREFSSLAIHDLDNFSDEWQVKQTIKFLEAEVDSKVIVNIEPQGFNRTTVAFLDSIPEAIPTLVIGEDPRLEYFGDERRYFIIMPLSIKLETIKNWLLK